MTLLLPVAILHDRINAYLAVLLIPFLSTALFILDPRASFPFDQYFFGLWFVFVLARWSAFGRLPRIEAVDILVLVYVAVGLLYLALSRSSALGYEGFKYDHRPLLIYLLLRGMGSLERDWRRVLTCVFIVMFLVLADALYRYAFDYLSVFAFQVKRSANLPDVVLGIASHYGLASQKYARLASIWMFATGLGPMLMVVSLMLLGLRRLIAPALGTAVYGFMFTVTFVALILTYSRSGWLGLALGTVVLIALEDNPATRLRFLKGTVLFLGLCAVILVVSGRLEQILGRFAQIGTVEFGEGGHFYFLAISLAAIAANPFGLGLGTGFATQVGSAASVVWNESTYLRVGMEKGVLPMMLLLVILAMLTRRMYQRVRASTGNQRIFYRTAFAISIVTLLINVTFPYWATMMMHLFFFFAAYAVNDSTGNMRSPGA